MKRQQIPTEAHRLKPSIYGCLLKPTLGSASQRASKPSTFNVATGSAEGKYFPRDCPRGRPEGVEGLDGCRRLPVHGLMCPTAGGTTRPHLVKAEGAG
jgi:hypothetical protein